MGVLRGTTSALEVGGVTARAAIPDNTLVSPVVERSSVVIRTGAQWGPGVDVEINWHPAPKPQMKSGFEEFAEFDVTCERQVRVDALAGGDYLVLDTPGGDARLRLSANGRPRGLAAEADDDPGGIVERYCLDFWQQTDEAPAVLRTLNKNELVAALAAARAANNG